MDLQKRKGGSDAPRQGRAPKSPRTRARSASNDPATVPHTDATVQPIAAPPSEATTDESVALNSTSAPAKTAAANASQKTKALRTNSKEQQGLWQATPN